MIGFSHASISGGVPDIRATPSSLIQAKLTFSGEILLGGVQNEKRLVTGLIVTNNHPFAVSVEIESEETKEKFTGTIQSEETKTIPILPLEIYWNTQGPIGFPGRWDGLNIKWKIPA